VTVNEHGEYPKPGKGCVRSGYDSRPDTLEHIETVRKLLVKVVGSLVKRGINHDRSKLEEPEKSTFDRVTPKLRDSEYGSADYGGHLKSMGPALKHHYAHNDHHPEFFDENPRKRPDYTLGMNLPSSVQHMNIMQLTEMLCDWMAAGRRHDPPTDIHHSIEVNRKRFLIPDAICTLLHVTADEILRLEALPDPE
jgi:hypothetical protein